MFFFDFFIFVFIFYFYVFFSWSGVSFIFDFCFFSLFDFYFSFCFVFDLVSYVFFCCVSFISFVVFFMVFFMYWIMLICVVLDDLFFFVGSMFIVVFSGNFFTVMLGWDGLGLVSFCLVVFYNSFVSSESGLVTFITNRVGDCFFVLSFYFFCFSGLFFFDSFFSFYVLVFLIFIFFGSVTKSAQIPFSAWLPLAMSAPTPVSSLVHSSTLVTAGVYLLIRFNYVFIFLDFMFLKVFFVFTMVVAGLSACFESDFKKVVAMSTLSQLGMMIFVLSLGLWVFCFIHVLIHAFFKSMLFLSTGSVMGQWGGLQDSRFFGCGMFFGFSFLNFLVSFFCLGGFSFFLGFYSKDYIIFGSGGSFGFFMYIFFVWLCFNCFLWFASCYCLFFFLFEGFLLFFFWWKILFLYFCNFSFF